MKTYRLTTLALLALLPIACSKEGDGRLRLYAEDMHSDDGAKVWVDPTDVNTSASWVTGEQINLNGAPYSIANDDENHYLNIDETAFSSLPDNLYAIYPASVNADGNDITVTLDEDGNPDTYQIPFTYDTTTDAIIINMTFAFEDSEDNTISFQLVFHRNV